LIVKLHDALGYLVDTLDVPTPLPQIIIWGDTVFLKYSKRAYRQASHYIIQDTR